MTRPSLVEADLVGANLNGGTSAGRTSARPPTTTVTVSDNRQFLALDNGIVKATITSEGFLTCYCRASLCFSISGWSCIASRKEIPGKDINPDDRGDLRGCRTSTIRRPRRANRTASVAARRAARYPTLSLATGWRFHRRHGRLAAWVVAPPT
jgi:hypothetical protein